ncbi:potassium transporter 7-like [Impatiens glandulifera]|uniref:potassium transporter 7-like n=1 Tax=Impatiens glandulifera TaxID=253017 RepID=UPI001FB12936|nr:potassium transporter 7-like [Impatiens glandulifera]
MVENKNQGKHVLLLAYQSFRLVHGDLSTSPLYVYISTFTGRLYNHQTEDVVFGVFSLIFWTLTILLLFKYVLFMLTADDNGEGGPFALYSLLCRHGKFSLLSNYQAVDEEITSYQISRDTSGNVSTSQFKRFIEQHKSMKTCLLVMVLFGASLLLCDGVLTPAISVLASVEGLRAHDSSFQSGWIVFISCAILVGLFAMQHRGTFRVAFLFAPIVLLWLLVIAALGLYNVIKWNPKIYLAFSPVYIYKFFKETGLDGWLSLGGIILCITGSGAMFTNLGHFTAASIRVSFSFVVYPCLVLQYMGQAAYITKNYSKISSSFYSSVPDPFFWPVFVVANLAAIITCQAVISSTFSIVKQCNAFSCFPRVKVVQKERWMDDQIYIPEMNWILMILSVIILIGFQKTTLLANAYGIACIVDAFVTTLLVSLVIIFVRQKNFIYSVLFLLFFGSLETIYLLSSFAKIPLGGWVSFVLSFFFLTIMLVWHYGTKRKYLYDLQNKLSMRWVLGLGPSLGIVRVPGICLIYTEMVTGVPALFSHFMTNVPAIQQVIIFITVKSVPIPYVSPKERYLIGRIGPKTYRMYRCIVRYGYQDVHKDDDSFENHLVLSISEFIRLEAEGSVHGIPGERFGMRLVMSEAAIGESSGGNSYNRRLQKTTTVTNGKSAALLKLQESYEQESAQLVQRKRNGTVRSSAQMNHLHPQVRDELNELMEARDGGLTYIMGYTHMKVKRNSTVMKKFVIDIAYSFLRKNCRAPAVTLSIPHISLIGVGMNYHV